MLLPPPLPSLPAPHPQTEDQRNLLIEGGVRFRVTGVEVFVKFAQNVFPILLMLAGLGRGGGSVTLLIEEGEGAFYPLLIGVSGGLSVLF